MAFYFTADAQTIVEPIGKYLPIATGSTVLSGGSATVTVPSAFVVKSVLFVPDEQRGPMQRDIRQYLHDYRHGHGSCGLDRVHSTESVRIAINPPLWVLFTVQEGLTKDINDECFVPRMVFPIVGYAAEDQH